MKIIPLGRNIQIEVQEASAGVLSTAGKPSAVEYAKVLAVGEEVKSKIKIGDMIFYKSWACDIITKDEKEYRFINEESGGILAIIK